MVSGMENAPRDWVCQSLISVDFLSQFVAALQTVPAASISDFYQVFLKKYSLPDMPGKTVIFTPGVILGLLYVAIVLPKEEIVQAIPETGLGDLDEGRWGRIQINLWDYNGERRNLRSLVKHLRNSLAHGRFCVSEDWSFVFSDNRPGRSETEFRVTMDFESLGRFVEALAKAKFARRATIDAGTT